MYRCYHNYLGLFVVIATEFYMMSYNWCEAQLSLVICCENLLYAAIINVKTMEQNIWCASIKEVAFVHIHNVYNGKCDGFTKDAGAG